MWSFNFFFYNRKLKRILYFACRGRSRAACASASANTSSKAAYNSDAEVCMLPEQAPMRCPSRRLLQMYGTIIVTTSSTAACGLQHPPTRCGCGCTAAAMLGVLLAAVWCCRFVQQHTVCDASGGSVRSEEYG